MDTDAKRTAGLNFGTPFPISFPIAGEALTDFNKASVIDCFLITAAPTPAVTGRVRSRIRKAVLYGLSLVTQANGYNYTVGDVPEKEKSVEQMINFPAVNVVFGREVYDPLGHSFGYLHKRLPVSFHCYVKSINDVKQAQMKVLADLEKYFMNNRDLPSEDGEATYVGDIMVASSQEFGIFVNRPYGRISVEMQIDYLQNVLDPDLSTMATSTPTLDSDPPSSISISKKEELRQALRTNLLTITAANGYQNTVGEVNAQVKSFEQLKNFPVINISNGSESTLNVNNHSWHDQFLHKQLNIDLWCVAQGINDNLTAQEDILADVEEMLMNKFSLPDSTGKKTTISTKLVDNEFFGMEVNRRLRPVVRVGVQFIYRQLLTNPTEITST